MSVVVDASVALKWVLGEPGSEAALALRTEEMIAPVLWLAEAANALWRGVRVGQLTLDDAADLLDELAKAPVVSLPMERYLKPALVLAVEMSHPIYDCIYLALAMQQNTHVMTADRRFAAAVDRSPLAGRVHLLGSSLTRTPPPPSGP